MNSKCFMLSFSCTFNNEKFLKIIQDDLCSSNDLKDNKYLTWIRYLTNTYFLFSSDNTTWDQEKICEKIHDFCEKESLNPSFIVVEVNNINGYMTSDFWKNWKKFRNINQYVDNLKRYKKLKKLKDIMDQKETIKKKEEEIKRKEAELKKKEEDYQKEQERINELLILQKKEDELKRREEELNKKINGQKKWWKNIFKS